MEIRRKYPFMKRMAAQEVPLRLRFELTRRCNLRCIHCKVHLNNAPANELSPREISGLLDQLREAGTMEISITGGEVFARPDIIEVLEALFSKDFFVHIQTNAAGITQEHIALLAKHRKKIKRVAASVYAGDPALHDSITRVPGSLARTMEALFALRRAGVPVFCFTLLMKENAARAAETKHFFEEHDLPHQFSTFIIPRDDGCAAPVQRRVSDDVLSALPVDWYRYLNPDGPEDRGKFHADATLDAWCPVGRYAVITATGDVIPCSLIREPAGNIREQPFMDIWSQASVMKELRALRLGELECFSCDLFPACKPCVGLAYLEHGDLRKRPSEMCRLSRALLRGPAPHDNGK